MKEEYFRITSASNTVMKEVRNLAEKKGRVKSGAFVVEGVKLVTEALSYRISIRFIIVSDSFIPRFETMLPELSGVRVYQVPDFLFSKISTTESPQGILAVADFPVGERDSLLKQFTRCVILENVQDPGNVGTIIRTADACGFDGILLSSGCADPYNPKVLRSAMGSAFHLPVITCEDIYDTIKSMKASGMRIVAAHPRDAAILWDSPLADNIAVVIGNEGSGLSELMLDLTDVCVMIPMPGKAESFNAAAAASILMYESMRQKMTGLCKA